MELLSPVITTEKNGGLRRFVEIVKKAMRREQTPAPETALRQAQSAIDKYIGARAQEPNFLELVSGENGGPQLIDMMKNSKDAQYRQVLHPYADVGEQENELAHYAMLAARKLRDAKSK